MIVLGNSENMCIYKYGLEIYINELVEKYIEEEIDYDDFCNAMEDLTWQKRTIEEMEAKGYDGCYFQMGENEKTSFEQILGAKLVLEIEDEE